MLQIVCDPLHGYGEAMVHLGSLGEFKAHIHAVGQKAARGNGHHQKKRDGDDDFQEGHPGFIVHQLSFVLSELHSRFLFVFRSSVSHGLYERLLNFCGVFSHRLGWARPEAHRPDSG